MEETFQKYKDSIQVFNDANGTGDLSKLVKTHQLENVQTYNENSQTDREKLSLTVKVICINTNCENVKCDGVNCEVVPDKTVSNCDRSCANIHNLADARLEDQNCGVHDLPQSLRDEPQEVARSGPDVHCAGSGPDVQGARSIPDMQEAGSGPDENVPSSRLKKEVLCSRPDAQGAGIGPDSQGVGIGPDVQGAGIGPDVQEAGIGSDVQGDDIGLDVQEASIGHDVPGAGSRPDVPGAGSRPDVPGAGSRPDLQRPGSGPDVHVAGERPGVQEVGNGPDAKGGDGYVDCEAVATTGICVIMNSESLALCEEGGPKVTIPEPAITSLLVGTTAPCDSGCDKVPGAGDIKQDVSAEGRAPMFQSSTAIVEDKGEASSDKAGINSGKITTGKLEEEASEAMENEDSEDGSDDFSGEPPHDVEVAIINGPVSTSESGLNNSLAQPQNQNNSVASLVNSDGTSIDDDYDNFSYAGLFIGQFDDEDDELDPRLMDINMLQSPDQEVPPLYEVGPYVTSRCEICLEYKYLYLRLCCGTSVCDVCMTTYLESVIQTGKVKIECPGICQQKYIHRDEIIGRVSIEMKAKYCKFLVDANNEAHIKTCPRCSHIVHAELEEIRNPRIKKKGLAVTCPECQLYWCFPCQAPWHEGITCKDHRKGNKLLRKWAKERFMGQLNAQKCPRCKVFIQRITGCDHMTCSKCDTSFCYRCGERYLHLRCIGDHYSRFSVFGCKYIYLPDQPVQRRLVRGSIFGAKMLAAPVVGVLALGIGTVILSGALVFFLPFYGLNKLRKHRKEVRRRQAAAEERARWQHRVAQIRAAGDPYISQYNKFQQLGIRNPGMLVTASQSHEQQRASHYERDEDYKRRLEQYRRNNIIISWERLDQVT